MKEILLPSPVEGLYLAPATQDLVAAEIELVDEADRATRLRTAIDALLTEMPFDDVLIDCPPSLGLLTVNALIAANEVLVPLQCEYYALEGLTHLMATIERVRQRLAEKQGAQGAERLKEILSEVAPEALPDDLSDAPQAGRFERVINIKDRGQIFRVDVGDIERIDAAGDYMCIYTADQTLVLRETMKDLERRLDPKKFQRIHRSTIVNLDNIKSVKPHTNGECFLVLGSGTQVKVSRSYRDVVARFL